MTAELAVGLPILLLLGGAGVLLVLHAVAPADERATVWVGALFILASTTAVLAAPASASAAGGAIALDPEASLFGALVGLVAVLALMAATPAILDAPAAAAHLVALTLASTAGALVTVMGQDLVVLLGGWLLVWFPLELIGRLTRRGGWGTAPTIAASALALVAAIVLLSADLGGTHVAGLAEAGNAASRAGLALAVTAFGLGAGLLPLAPRATSAASAPDVPFRMIVPAIAAFAALVRLGSAAGASADTGLDWRATIAILAAVAVVVPTLAASVERSLAGLVGHAGTAQLGYVAIALAAGSASGSVAAALAVAAVTVVACAAAVSTLGGGATVGALGGFARARPLHAASLAVALLAVAGAPGTFGFVARAAVFADAAREQLAWLLIVGALAGAAWMVIALRVLVAATRGGRAWARGDVVSTGVLIACAAALVVFGVVPGPLLDVLREAGR